MDCCSYARVILLPPVSPCLSLLLRPARYGLAVQRVAGHDRLRIHSIGSLREKKGVGVQGAASSLADIT
jgi:hypothetical protein